MNLIDSSLDLSAFAEPANVHQVRSADRFKKKTLDILSHKNQAVGTPLPWLKTRDLIEFRPGELSIWTGYKGHGKALDVETPIPTPSGWKLMGELVVGDVVFDENGKHCNIVAATEVMHNRPCYRMEFSDGTVVIADEMHQWLTSNYAARTSEYHAKRNGRNCREVVSHGTDQSSKRIRPSVVTTGEIAKTLRVYETGTANALNHSVQAAGAIAMPHSDLPIDPYLLGAWLGDGSSNGAVITIADDEMLFQLTARVGNFQITKHASMYNYGITGGMQKVLRKMGLLKNKHIPEEYLRGSYEQRLELMRGLLDTDGHVDKTGRVEFCNTNKRMAYSVLELARTLGIVATIINGRAILNGKDCGEKYRVCFTTSLPVFGMQRKAARLKQVVSIRNSRRFIVSCEQIGSVPVRCIQVDSASHLFLATSAFIPTHNSMLLSQAMLHCMRLNQRVLIVSPEFKPEEVLARKCRQESGSSRPPSDFVDRWFEYAKTRLWLFDHQGALQSDNVVALCRYAATQLEINHIVIDSLMKCGIGVGSDDYSKQKSFVDKLQSVAHQCGPHIHLVAHARKGASDDSPAGLHDVKGTSEIGDMAENVFSVWRNKPKHKAMSAGDQSKASEPDALLVCEAQRNGSGWNGSLQFWFDPQSCQYIESLNDNPRCFEPAGVSEEVVDF